jgi:tetratricopeptide (TPR) repeat protein
MRLIVFLFLIIIGVVGYLAYLNPGYITFYWTKQSSIEVPTTALVLLSMAVGGGIVVLVSGAIETKHLFVTWRLARLQKRKERIDELLRQGLNAKASRKFSEAMDLFRRVLDLEPNHIPTLLRLGNLYRMQGQALDALRLHRKAKSLDENNMDVVLSLSKDLEELNRVEDAIQALEEALKIDKDCLVAQTQLRDLYVRLNRWEEAHAVQERILAGNLNVEEKQQQQAWLEGIKYEQGHRLLEQGHRERARRYFRGCIKLNKNFIPAYVGLGEALEAEGRAQEAAKIWEKAYEVTSNIVLLHRLEDFYLSQDQPSEILRVYQEAIRRDPNNQVLQFYLGKLYYRLEMMDEAFDVLAGMDLGEDRMPDLYKILGNLYLRKGDLQAAVEEFKKALNLRKRVLIPYYCPPCDFHTIQWTGRCPRCGRWNSFVALPIRKKETSATTIAPS